MDDLEIFIQNAVIRILGNGVDIASARGIAAHLVSPLVGVRSLEELRFVTPDDLRDHIVPIKARQLVAAWQQDEGMSTIMSDLKERTHRKNPYQKVVFTLSKHKSFRTK